MKLVNDLVLAVCCLENKFYKLSEGLLCMELVIAEWIVLSFSNMLTVNFLEQP